MAALPNFGRAGHRSSLPSSAGGGYGVPEGTSVIECRNLKCDRLIWPFSKSPQWAVVGDTFPVGCRFQNSIVFRDNSFTDNPDERNPLYKSVPPIYLETSVPLVVAPGRLYPVDVTHISFSSSPALNTGSTSQTAAWRTSTCRGATTVRDAFRRNTRVSALSAARQKTQ